MPTQQTVFDQQYNLYRQWGCSNDYDINSGDYVIPLALSQEEIDAGEDPVVVVGAHAPYQRRRMTFKANKEGGPPVLPAPASVGAFGFLGGSLSFWPTGNANGTATSWEVAGSYTFIQSCRSDYADGYVLSGFPFPLSLQEGSAYAGVNGPTTGPLVDAGADVLAGYLTAQELDLTTPYWEYACPTYFPGQLFDPAITVGGLPLLS